MQFKNSFSIPLSLQESWDLILDIPTVLPCLPGAQLKGTDGDAKYAGVVQVKLGPVKLSFEGEAEIIEKDLENHIVYMRGSGTDRSEKSVSPMASSVVGITLSTPGGKPASSRISANNKAAMGV